VRAAARARALSPALAATRTSSAPRQPRRVPARAPAAEHGLAGHGRDATPWLAGADRALAALHASALARQQ
jgi:hypothetical protein